ncbi:MAG: PAS domain-containing sensor histidine kinase [Desulfuromonadales bacterium]
MSKRVFLTLLLFVFLAELAVMKAFDPMLSLLPPSSAGLFDASILALLLIPPLWLMSWRLSTKEAQVSANRFIYRGRVSLFLQLLATVFAIEYLVMFFLPVLLPELTGGSLALLDATLIILFILPLFWWRLLRVDARFNTLPLSEFLGSPSILYGTLLYAVFVADLIQEIVQPYVTPGWLAQYFIVIDSTMTTAIIAPFLWLLVGRPLTKAAQAEKTRARTILDQVADAVVTLDAKGRVSSINPAAQKLFDYTYRDLAGKPFDVLFAEDQLDIQQTITQALSTRTADQKLMFREIPCRTSGGVELTMNISLSCILQLEHEEWLLILHDISHHKETEKALRERDERFRQIFQQTDDAIVFVKPSSSLITDVNTTFAELFGYSKTEILGRGLALIFKDGDFSKVSSAIIKTSLGTPVTLSDVVGMRRSGMRFNVSMHSKLMTIDGVNLVFCSFRDISNRLRLEKEAKEIQAKLIQTNKMTSLGLMVSGVAHEINNPNNFIKTNSRLLASTWQDNRKILLEYSQEHGDFCLGGIPFSELDTYAPQLFAGILEGSDRINEIVKNLKYFYRPDRATGSSININQVAASAASLLHHELVSFTRRFHIALADDLPTIKGNSQQIGQVVINLLMNACQALPDNSHGIWLETGYVSETSQVTLMVRDEGRGMTPAESGKIMEPFFTTKLDEGGTGLGLTICKSIITDHKGTLEFASTPGKGTTFMVRLPADLPAAKDEKHAPERQDTRTRSGSAG